MNFVKTRSLVYSPFHSTARNINFKVGYWKDAKWLESINDKWSEYANFFVGGFLEAVYSSNDKTYAQIDAKMIDYDARFRNPQLATSTASQKTPVNAFALRRNDSVTPTTPKSVSSVVADDTQVPNNEKNSIIIDDGDSASRSIDDNEFSKFIFYYKKFQQETQSSSTDSHPSITPITPIRQSKKRQLSDLCESDDNSDKNFDSDNNINNDPADTLDKNPANDSASTNDKTEKGGKGGRGKRSGRGVRGGKGGRGVNGGR
jgi:hypothetical protein